MYVYMLFFRDRQDELHKRSQSSCFFFPILHFLHFYHFSSENKVELDVVDFLVLTLLVVCDALKGTEERKFHLHKQKHMYIQVYQKPYINS